ncbi:MAG: hypothetical protein ABWZ53_02275 [Actinomycetota bacterium]
MSRPVESPPIDRFTLRFRDRDLEQGFLADFFEDGPTPARPCSDAADGARIRRAPTIARLYRR